MPDLFFERHVPHVPERMFDLVNDLVDYPRFLPNISGMEIKRDEGARGDVVYAKMTIQFGPVTQAYTSRVEANRSERTITAKAVDGPFSYLDSKWTFEPEGAGSVTAGRAEIWREDYQGVVARHRAAIRAETDRRVWSFAIHRTDRPASELLLVLHARMGVNGKVAVIDSRQAPAPAGSAA